MTSKQIKILSYNIQGKYSEEKDNTVDPPRNKRIIKLHRLITYMKDNKFDIAMIQETKASPGWVEETVKRVDLKANVIECANTMNNNKGGVAVISVNPDIKSASTPRCSRLDLFPDAQF